MTAAVLQVLVVEDDLGDVLMIREAFGDTTGRRSNLSVVGDGVDALAFLRKQGDFTDAPDPDFILLDLNLPCVDGREVLAEVKVDEALRHIPVVVLTTSDAPEDILASYRLHASAYVTKPVDFECFLTVIHQIEDFFAGLALLPRART